MPAPEIFTLYERLGGVYRIAAIVDDFIDRIMTDPRLSVCFSADAAQQRIRSAGLKYLVTELVCHATGRPGKYTGRTLFDSLIPLLNHEPAWKAFMDDFRQTLHRFQVPPLEQSELTAIVENTRAEMVSTVPM